VFARAGGPAPGAVPLAHCRAAGRPSVRTVRSAPGPPRLIGGVTGVYDFSPSAEQARVLVRVSELMDELVYPNESQSVPHRGLPRDLLKRLQARVKAEGLWAAHLPAEAGGLGMGNVTLGLINEQLGRSPIAPPIFA